MKKKLLTDSIANELEGASLFFTRSATSLPATNRPVEKAASITSQSPAEAQTQASDAADASTRKPEESKTKTNGDTMTPRYHDTTASRYHDTTQPSIQASIHGVEIEIVRKAVKEFGKEAATHRFTDAEKRQMADLIYTYKNSGIRTSENEITRIAVNFVIQDYRENGEQSVLHKILLALNE